MLLLHLINPIWIHFNTIAFFRMILMQSKRFKTIKILEYKKSVDLREQGNTEGDVTREEKERIKD